MKNNQKGSNVKKSSNNQNNQKGSNYRNIRKSSNNKKSMDSNCSNIIISSLLLLRVNEPVSYTHLTLPTTTYV